MCSFEIVRESKTQCRIYNLVTDHDSEIQFKLFFMLSLNERCGFGFPSVCLMENSDLLMTIASGKNPTLACPSSAFVSQTSYVKSMEENTERMNLLLIWHCLQGRKYNFLFRQGMMVMAEEGRHLLFMLEHTAVWSWRSLC